MKVPRTLNVMDTWVGGCGELGSPQHDERVCCAHREVIFLDSLPCEEPSPEINLVENFRNDSDSRNKGYPVLYIPTYPACVSCVRGSSPVLFIYI